MTVSHFIEEWNDLALQLKRPLAEVTTKKRSAAIASLIKDYSIDQLKRAFWNARQSTWLPTFQGFTVDWLIKPDNFVKVLEGHYNGTTAARKSGCGFTDAIDRSAAANGGYGNTEMDDALERAGHQIIGRRSPRRNGSIQFGDALKNITPTKAGPDV
ncbi:hypothetical protein OKA06_13390 [Novosphingobium sp. MW5]|nr:hypothetical protein [Novosphingobium sp. MW5]